MRKEVQKAQRHKGTEAQLNPLPLGEGERHRGSLLACTSVCRPFVPLCLCAFVPFCIFLSSCKHIPQKNYAVSQTLHSMPTKEDVTQTPCQLPTASSCSVSMFTNESCKYGLEEVFTNLLLKEIVYDGRIDVGENGENGDSTLFLEEKIGCCPHFPLKGKILSYERLPVSYGADYIDKYRLSMKIEIIILNRSNEVIETKIFEDFIDFIPVSSPLTNKGFVYREEDKVIQELCLRICHQVVNQIIRD